MEVDISNQNLVRIEFLNSTSTLILYSELGTRTRIITGEIYSLNCSFNQLKTLPELPKSLKELSCYKNHLISLPKLPETLERLWCAYNHIELLPELPKTLTVLSCFSNNLTNLPSFPETIKELWCGYNSIPFVSPLPSRPIYYGVPAELEELHSRRNYNNYRTRYRSYKFLITFLAINCKLLPTILSSELFLFWK